MIWRDALGWPVEQVIGRPYHNCLRVFFQQIRGGWKQTWTRRNDKELPPRPLFADGVLCCPPLTFVGAQNKRPLNLIEPTGQDLMSEEFNAVWNAIRGWYIQREPGAGYSGTTGTDVMTILVALGLSKSTSPPAGDSPSIKAEAVADPAASGEEA